MIIPDRQVLFIHIPKTAGTSIESALSHLAKKPTERLGLYSVDLGLLRNGSLFSALQDSSLKSFAFVRNPWDRLVSAYSHSLYADGNNHSIGFGEFLHLVEEYLGEKPESWFETIQDTVPHLEGVHIQLGSFKKLPNRDFTAYHVLPQTYFLKYGADFVGRFENLAQDFAKISEDLSLPIRSLPRLNASSHSDYRTYYRPNDVDIVARMYETEISAFAYEFEPSS